MKKIFAFGNTGIEVSVPDDFNVVELGHRSAVALADESAAIDHALEHPIGCAPLVEIAKGTKTAAISVCDITRPAPNRTTLPPLLKRLHQAGIAKEGITILIATGLHRVATKSEVDLILGPEIARNYTVISNDARAHGVHRFLGTTSRGTPVHIHERFMAADLHITLGFIEQHLMAGFSGGRKLVAPGLAAEPTIKTIHSPRFMRERLATEGSIAGNCLHEELLEIARMVRHDFMLDVTLTRERGISGVFAGEPVAAHSAGVQFLESTALECIEEPADVVITSAAGFPLDLTFYQTVKGVTAARHLVKRGGRILVVSECAEGVGSPEFARRMRELRSFEAFLEETAEAPVEVDQWQLEKLALTGSQARLFFYTPGVGKRDLGFLGDSAFSTIEEAMAAALEGLPRGARVALVPEGPYTFARAGLGDEGLATLQAGRATAADS